jgi:hypothetical protein
LAVGTPIALRAPGNHRQGFRRMLLSGASMIRKSMASGVTEGETGIRKRFMLKQKDNARVLFTSS